MKNRISLVILMMTVLLSVGCTSKKEGSEGQKNLTETVVQEESQIEIEEQEESQIKGEEQEESKAPEQNQDDLDDSNINSVLYTNTLDGVIDLSNVENISDLEYEVVLEGEYPELVKLSIKTNEGELLQEIEYESYFDKSWYDEYTNNGGELVRFFDINFDGYTDLICQSMGAMPNQIYTIILYNPNNEQFEINDEYNNLVNPKVCGKMILSSNYEMSNVSHELFEVVDTDLIYIGQLTVDVDENGNIKYVEQMNCDLDENGENIKFEEQTYNKLTDVKDVSKIWGEFTKYLEF